MIEVVPAIIPYSREQLEEEIGKVASFTKLVQIDISDGLFTGSMTWPYNGKDQDFFESLKKEEATWPQWENVNIELHLMVNSPENVISDWIQTGVSTIVAHIEATHYFQKVIDLCREKEVSVGVAIKPSTDISAIQSFIPQTDFIQVMGNDVLGRHGVPLDPKAVEKIKLLQKQYPNRIIAIDIGVSEATENILVSAGADKLISGGAILNADNPKEVFSYLQSL
jgi:ribulose-phosphate 3-epimerase